MELDPDRDPDRNQDSERVPNRDTGQDPDMDPELDKIPSLDWLPDADLREFAFDIIPTVIFMRNL